MTSSMKSFHQRGTATLKTDVEHENGQIKCNAFWDTQSATMERNTTVTSASSTDCSRSKRRLKIPATTSMRGDRTQQHSIQTPTIFWSKKRSRTGATIDVRNVKSSFRPRLRGPKTGLDLMTVVASASSNLASWPRSF